MGSKINFDSKPIVAIKSIFVKEYAGKLCLASHDDTQIIAEEQPLDSNENEDEELKVIQEKQKEPAKPIPKDLRNFRVNFHINFRL